MDRIVMIVNPRQRLPQGILVLVQTGAQVCQVCILIPKPGIDNTQKDIRVFRKHNRLLPAVCWRVSALHALGDLGMLMRKPGAEFRGCSLGSFPDRLHCQYHAHGKQASSQQHIAGRERQGMPVEAP